MRIRPSSLIVSWVLIAALAVTPLMAQDPSFPKVRVITNREEAIDIARRHVLGEPDARSSEDNRSPLVGTAILFALPSAKTPGPPPDPQATAPGKNKNVIVAIVGGTAIAALLYLLLRGGGGKPTPPPATTATVLTAGAPRVTNP